MSSRGWKSGRRSDRRGTRPTARSDGSRWRTLSGTVRFYGLFLLVTTKVADAITTAVGLLYVPGIVEMNPFADAVFAGHGTVVGLTVLSFLTIVVAALLAEFVALEARRRLHAGRLSLFAQATVYGALSLLFGAVAVHNGLLISGQLQQHLLELIAVGVVAPL